MHIKEHIVKELLLEFISTFTFYKEGHIDYDRESTIVFWLGGFLHSMSISNFRVKYGFYD